MIRHAESYAGTIYTSLRSPHHRIPSVAQTYSSIHAVEWPMTAARSRRAAVSSALP
jgi:hypothetical protein